MLLFSSLPVVCDTMKDGGACRGGALVKHIVINTAKLRLHAEFFLIHLGTCVSAMHQICSPAFNYITHSVGSRTSDEFLFQLRCFVFFPSVLSHYDFPTDLCGNCSNNFPLATSVCWSSVALTNRISRWNFSLRTDFGQIMSVGEHTDAITSTIKVGIGLHWTSD